MENRRGKSPSSTIYINLQDRWIMNINYPTKKLTIEEAKLQPGGCRSSPAIRINTHIDVLSSGLHATIRSSRKHRYLETCFYSSYG
jgi:hypothetical protein